MADGPLFSDALPDVQRIRDDERLAALRDVLPVIEQSPTIAAAAGAVRLGIRILESELEPQGVPLAGEQS